MDTIKSEAGFFKKIGKRLSYRKAMKSVEQAERDYMTALTSLRNISVCCLRMLLN